MKCVLVFCVSVVIVVILLLCYMAFETQSTHPYVKQLQKKTCWLQKSALIIS